MSMLTETWNEWDGTDPGRTVLVKTEDGAVVAANLVAQSLWTVYCPGVPMLFQPHLQGRVTHTRLIPD